MFDPRERDFLGLIISMVYRRKVGRVLNQSWHGNNV